MTGSKQIKGLLAGVATIALIGTAMAQGSPPNPATTNAPTGAGQQSTQGTPMGTTGTPSGSGTAAGTSGSGTMGSTTPSSGGATPSARSAPPPADTSVASSGRRPRADRN